MHTLLNSESQNKPWWLRVWLERRRRRKRNRKRRPVNTLNQNVT
jgi:hypothetical protein